MESRNHFSCFSPHSPQYMRWAVLLLVAATVMTFWPVHNFPFIGYDDNSYVTENFALQNGVSAGTVRWAFTTAHAGNWHPLTWLSHALDVQLFGFDASGHHVTSLVIHLLNTVLLMLILQAMTGAFWRSALVSILFAIHPLHVESVAWVAERKDVLSGLFWMSTMGAYVWYSLAPSLPRYLMVVLCLVLGLLSKPMVVTLPFVLLLLDYWPLRRIGPAEAPAAPGEQRFLPVGMKRALLEKVPLVALSAASGVVTLVIQQRAGAVGTLGDYPIGLRLSNAAVSYVQYLFKMVYPVNMAFIYPHPGYNLKSSQILMSVLLLLSISLVVVLLSRRSRAITVGWLWYLVTLIPVIGLVQVGVQSMADRYTYLPLIGIFIALVWGAGDIIAPRAPVIRWSAAALGAALLIVLIGVTRSQLAVWRGNIPLFSHAVEVTSNNWMAHRLLGKSLVEEKRIPEAITHFRESLRIMPDFAETKMELAMVLFRTGETAEARRLYAEALRDLPEYRATLQFNMGNRLREQGRSEEAVERYREALRLKPDFAEARSNMEALLSDGRVRKGP